MGEVEDWTDNTEKFVGEAIKAISLKKKNGGGR